MVDRICISINNRCNLKCEYCHFREKGNIESASMDIIQILSNVKNYAGDSFKIGFVGNGEPLLDIVDLKRYITFLADSPNVHAYTITNGTVDISDEDWLFLDNHDINVGFSLDGFKGLHNMYRGNTFDHVMRNVEKYKDLTGHYPTFNATVGRESLNNKERVIEFFQQFGTKITFSRMIGKYAISLDEYQTFMTEAEKKLNVRRGGLDCTMYGGKCGVGANNFFFANGNVYFCGNCIDLPAIGKSNMSFEELEKTHVDFDRTKCYKESL